MNKTDFYKDIFEGKVGIHTVRPPNAQPAVAGGEEAYLSRLIESSSRVLSDPVGWWARSRQGVLVERETRFGPTSVRVIPSGPWRNFCSLIKISSKHVAIDSIRTNMFGYSINEADMNIFMSDLVLVDGFLLPKKESEA
ncbi:MAG TPA: hypothetical protein PKW79_04210 [Rhabdochlamydiaceae bacterium]|nr:hypothetical protein [Rhabdochlamydiaceae bacterium]